MPDALISQERLAAAAEDPVVWAGEMELIQRAFALQHPLRPGLLHLEDGDSTYELIIHIARTLEEKAIGWLGLTDEMESVGVLFEEPADSTRAFWNRGVDQALDLWTFAEDGQLLEHWELVADSSTAVRPTKPYRWALETEAGDLSLSTAAKLVDATAA